MSNTIIECRNKESDISVANGDWTTILGSTGITIDEGDQIFVKNCFIDTQATSSQQISIPDDIVSTIEFGYYRSMVDTTGLEPGVGNPAPILSNSAEEKVLTKLVESTDPNAVIYTSFNLLRLDENKINQPVNLKVSYSDYFDEIQTKSLDVSQIKSGETLQFLAMIGQLVKGNITYEPSLLTLNDKYNLQIKTETQSTNGKTIMLPHLAKQSVTIPKGNYDPDKLCELINTSITGAFSNDFPLHPTTNSILKNSQQLQAEYRANNVNIYDFVFVNGSGAVEAQDNFYITNMKNFGTGNQIWIGTNQFELSFDSNTRNFQFDYLHMPYYYQQNLAVGFFEFLGIYYSVARSGGIFINSLESEYASTSANAGKPFNFWNQLLGFDNSILTTYAFSENNLGTPTNYLIPTFDLNEKVTTNGLVSVDSFVDKTDPFLVPFVFPYYSSIGATQTRNISAGNSVLDSQAAFGYYVIEVASKFKNNFFTPDNNYRNIQSIVSRYYELNSYTSGTTQGSLIYTHTGESQLLESFRCRILDSDKNLAANIGNDNTIHLAIIKAPQQLQLKDKSSDEK